jgi:DNA-3-methyladenine glycosylase II
MTDVVEVHRTVLPAAAPYSFALSLRALAGFAPCAGDQCVSRGAVRKAFHAGDGGAVVAEVRATAGGAGPGVALTVHAARPLDPHTTTRVARDVSRWLGLDDDLTGFLAAADADPAMAPLLAVARGLHQVRFPSLAEGAVYFTLTQRSTQAVAASRKRRIAAEHGPAASLDGVAYSAFPSLDTVAALDDATLARLAGGPDRAHRVRSVAAGLARLDEEWLRTGPYERVREALLGIDGVGPFTAHAILLRVLGRPDDVPLDMAQFRRTASAVYGDPPPAPGELRARYGRWIGWWAYLARMASGWHPATAHGPLAA